MSYAMAVTAALALALLPRIWWLLVARPRFQKRCDRYIEHIDCPLFIALGAKYRCGCPDCDAFAHEMGWRK
jgi:hypothetical protein